MPPSTFNRTISTEILASPGAVDELCTAAGFLQSDFLGETVKRRISKAPSCRRTILPELVRDWGWNTGSKVESHWTQVNGWKVHCRRSRESRGGIPIVFVHGLVISSLYFLPLAECLSSWATVYVPDQPGFGLSEGPSRALTISEMAQALVEWMDIEGIAECHIVANSLGCQIATAMAVNAPGRFRTLTLIGPTVDPAVANFWSQTVRIFWDAPHEPLQLWMNHALDQWRAGCRRIWAMIFHMLNDRIEERLPHIRQPTCVLRGKHDPTASDEWVQRVASLLPRGQAHTLPGWHCVHYSHPSLTAQAVLDFIKHTQVIEAKA